MLACSRGISWCLTENYGNGDQRRPMGRHGSVKDFTVFYFQYILLYVD